MCTNDFRNGFFRYQGNSCRDYSDSFDLDYDEEYDQEYDQECDPDYYHIKIYGELLSITKHFVTFNWEKGKELVLPKKICRHIEFDSISVHKKTFYAIVEQYTFSSISDPEGNDF